MRVSPPTAAACLLMVLCCACGHGQPGTGVSPDQQRLGGLVGQALMIAPVQSLRIAPELGWPAPKSAELLASLDQAITDTLRARVGNAQWTYAAALIESARNNPTYATDPHALSTQPLRSPKLQLAQRLPEPLASQLRTMIALHDGRLVLIPVELHVDRTTTGGAKPVLHLVLVDARLSDVRWIGDVTGPDNSTLSATTIASIAATLADQFVAK